MKLLCILSKQNSKMKTHTLIVKPTKKYKHILYFIGIFKLYVLKSQNMKNRSFLFITQTPATDPLLLPLPFPIPLPFPSLPPPPPPPPRC